VGSAQRSAQPVERAAARGASPLRMRSSAHAAVPLPAPPTPLVAASSPPRVLRVHGSSAGRVGVSAPAAAASPPRPPLPAPAPPRAPPVPAPPPPLPPARSPRKPHFNRADAYEAELASQLDAVLAGRRRAATAAPPLLLPPQPPPVAAAARPAHTSHAAEEDEEEGVGAGAGVSLADQLRVQVAERRRALAARNAARWEAFPRNA
jgi:hypothetical protein